jgi:hypothetical protein
VAEVGRKRREPLLDIDPLVIPAEKRPDSEAMPEVVYATPGVIARRRSPISRDKRQKTR